MTSPAQNERPQVLLISQVGTRYHRDIVRGILAYAHENTNWRLISHSVLHAAEERRMRPSGVISLSDDAAVIAWAKRSRAPLVLVGNASTDPSCSVVSVEEGAVGEMAAEYLAGLGIKHFAYLGHGQWPFVHQRLAGYQQTLQRKGLSLDATLIGSLYDDRRRARFLREMRTILQQLPRPCGVLAANDALAVEAVSACGMEGLRVPEDIAILGVDDDELACELSEVPISSVAQPLRAIGQEAARILHQQMQRAAKAPTRRLLSPLRVVVRASTDLIALQDPDVVAALRLINENFEKPINVAWAMRQLPVARRTLERRFKAMVGRTILEQIHHLRLAKAKQLLVESDLSLETVAQRSGFANARWLADCFRRELEVTPLRYRRQWRVER